jgi:dephospho-CoA kinase
MLVIGLTGGIGCGKTTVTDLFSELNVPISDADVIAHKLVAPGQPALNKIIETFGDEVKLENGQLNRSYLRQLIFNNPDAKKLLEKILHPLVYQQMNDWAVQQEAPYVIFSIPLLIETNQQNSVDRVLIIDLSQEQQVSRVIRRDNISEKEVLEIISSQTSRSKRREIADDLILNNSSQEDLRKQVIKLHNFYLSLSTS